MICEERRSECNVQQKELRILLLLDIRGFWMTHEFRSIPTYIRIHVYIIGWSCQQMFCRSETHESHPVGLKDEQKSA